jgi:predicted ribosome quality control (RQC) complex YloA/Tae2 family protein
MKLEIGKTYYCRSYDPVVPAVLKAMFDNMVVIHHPKSWAYNESKCETMTVELFKDFYREDSDTIKIESLEHKIRSKLSHIDELKQDLKRYEKELAALKG